MLICFEQKCGVELAADDVFEVIKEIDEDGNGKLDREEFFELLVLLDVVEEEEEH